MCRPVTSVLVWCLIVLSMVISGCAVDSIPSPKELFSWKPGPKNPGRVLAVWTDTIMNQPARAGVRGVGGRLIFYDADHDETVKVEGTLTVYAYYAESPDSENTVPARKYVFLPDQFERHYSKSKIGHSYSVWLPWDEAGGPPRQLTLIARFEPKGGAAILSDPARQFLPGVATIPIVKQKTIETHVVREGSSDSNVQATSHVEEVKDRKSPEETKTITIDIPSDVARRWNVEGLHTPDKFPELAQTSRLQPKIHSVVKEREPESLNWNQRQSRPLRGFHSRPVKRLVGAQPRPRPDVGRSQSPPSHEGLPSGPQD